MRSFTWIIVIVCTMTFSLVLDSYINQGSERENISVSTDFSLPLKEKGLTYTVSILAYKESLYLVGVVEKNGKELLFIEIDARFQLKTNLLDHEDWKVVISDHYSEHEIFFMCGKLRKETSKFYAERKLGDKKIAADRKEWKHFVQILHKKAMTLRDKFKPSELGDSLNKSLIRLASTRFNEPWPEIFFPELR